MNSIKKLMPTSAALMALSTTALAHPGHDHSHWSSSAHHALFLAALVLVAGAGYSAYRHFRQRSRENIQEGK